VFEFSFRFGFPPHRNKSFFLLFSKNASFFFFCLYLILPPSFLLALTQLFFTLFTYFPSELAFWSLHLAASLRVMLNPDVPLDFPDVFSSEPFPNSNVLT